MHTKYRCTNISSIKITAVTIAKTQLSVRKSAFKLEKYNLLEIKKNIIQSFDEYFTTAI